MTIDDEIERMRQEDMIGATKMTVIEYARLHGMRPQLLYYYIRTGRIEQEDCVCGRRVIDVERVDAFLQAKEKESRRDLVSLLW